MGILDVPGYSRAQVDQKIADATIASDGARPATLPNTLMTLGDSMVASGWQGLQSTLVADGRAVGFWAQIQSGGRLVLHGGTGVGPAAGVDGYTTTQIVNQLLPLVEAARPGLCAVIMGANDFGGALTLAQTLDNFRTVFRRLRQAGVTPIVCTTPPRNGPPPNIAPVNAFLRTFARSQGLPFADLFSALVDPAGPGLYKPALTGDSGGHPNGAGAKVMGKVIADAIEPFVPANIVPLPSHNLASGTVDRVAVATDNSLLLDGGATPGGWDVDPATVAMSPGPTVGRQVTVTRDAVANAGALRSLTGISPGDRCVLAAEISSVAVPGGNFAFSVRGQNPVAGINAMELSVEPGSIYAQEFVWNGTGTPTLGATARAAENANVTFSRPVILNLTAAGLI